MTNAQFNTLINNIEIACRMRNEFQKDKEILLHKQSDILMTVDMMPKINAILNALYDKVAGKIIKACEAAITDATHEIIGDNTNIGMDISTKNGQIHVDIGSTIQTKDSRVLRSIVDGEGGGLTNVVCFSLRAIIVSRSQQRKFIIIDEPDCWLDSSKINPFFNIIYKMAVDGGFQIIALTHHDTTDFEDRANILTLSRENKDSPVTLEVSGHVDSNLSKDNIITSVRLENFGGHENLLLPLAPGLNFIRGKSNIGKSRLLRALRCVILNEGNDGDISSYIKDSDDNSILYNISPFCAVEITFDGGKTLYWKRKRSGSPKETWTYKDSNGNIITLSDGTVCDNDKNGKDWVSSKEVMNIKQSEFANNKLCSQLHTQKMPMFAINENGNVLASLLSIGEDAGILRKMISLAREKENEVKLELKHINKRLDEISLKLMNYAKLDTLINMANELKEEKEHYEHVEETLNKINDIYHSYKLSHNKIIKYKQFINLIPQEPSFINFKKIYNLYYSCKNSLNKINNMNEFLILSNNISMPDIQDYSIIKGIYNNYVQSKLKLIKMNTFNQIFPNMIVIDNNINIILSKFELYQKTNSRINDLNNNINTISLDIINNKLELENLKKEYKICPTCGNAFEHQH